MLNRLRRLERIAKPKRAAELLPEEYHRRGLLTLAEALTDITGQDVTSNRLAETFREVFYADKIKAA